MQETRVWSLAWEDPLEKETAMLSSIIAWKIPWIRESGRLVHGVIRVRHNLATKPPPGFLGLVTSLAQNQSPLTTLLYLSVPVSRPVLTLTSSRMKAMVGDVVELHCESQSGSPPILYRFYHENVTLGSSSVPSGRAAFKLSLTAEHSGNYSCEAENSLGVQRSDRVILSVTGE